MSEKKEWGEYLEENNMRIAINFETGLRTGVVKPLFKECTLPEEGED